MYKVSRITLTLVISVLRKDPVDNLFKAELYSIFSVTTLPVESKILFSNNFIKTNNSSTNCNNLYFSLKVKSSRAIYG